MPNATSFINANINPISSTLQITGTNSIVIVNPSQSLEDTAFKNKIGEGEMREGYLFFVVKNTSVNQKTLIENSDTMMILTVRDINSREFNTAIRNGDL